MPLFRGKASENASEVVMDTKKTITLEEARLLIGNSNIAWTTLVEASAIVTNSSESTFEDLLKVLKIRGLPQEWAAIALYKRTKRPCKNNASEPLVMDFDDWATYLKKENLTR